MLEAGTTVLLNTLATTKRLPRRADAFMIPRAVERAPGQFLVDATWGRIMPMQLAPGVRTVGELEVLAHIEAGLPVVDKAVPLVRPRCGSAPDVGHALLRG